MESLKQLGYKFAKSVDDSQELAKQVLALFPEFADVSPKDSEKWAELDNGFALRFSELNPAQGYTIDWVPTTKKPAVMATLDWALSYSSQQLNSLKDSQPQMVAVARDMHRKWQQYRSARRIALVKAMQGKKDVKRSATKDFDTRVVDILGDLKKQCKTAESRGDTTANSDKFQRASVAFMEIWKA